MIEAILGHRTADLGHGLIVRRSLPQAQRRMVGPFVFLDHAGPVQLQGPDARRADVRPHPHIGLSTVSYLLGGAVMHRDSLGIEQAIRPGDVNWMTAGRGIAHSERFELPDAFDGGGLELLQSWVALSDEHEETAPAFFHHPAATLPEAEEDGVWRRWIAGEAWGLRSPVHTHSPMFYLHTRMQTGSQVALPAGYSERAAYVVHGGLDSEGRHIGPGSLVVFGPASRAVVKASEPSTVMLLGGEPVGPRFLWWNFVSSSKERIEQAKADWQAGRIALPPNDHDEFIPLP
jgi:redox-sensitive bicupin YhaK (pirin superfamily)